MGGSPVDQKTRTRRGAEATTPLRKGTHFGRTSRPGTRGAGTTGGRGAGAGSAPSRGSSAGFSKFPDRPIRGCGSPYQPIRAGHRRSSRSHRCRGGRRAALPRRSYRAQSHPARSGSGPLPSSCRSGCTATRAREGTAGSSTRLPPRQPPSPQAGR